MAESIVSSVAGRLGNLLIQESKFLQGVSGQVEQMQIELEMMQSYLEDADKRQDEDNRVRTWVSRIREAAYDAEAVLETFALKILSRRRGGIESAFKRYACIIDEAAELHKVGSEIEAIKIRLSNLRACLEFYGINRTRDGERQRQWLRSYSHVVEEDTVGLDKDVKTLVAQLLNEENQCGVVSICGMGGLGKTTLAKKVYHDRKIRHHFDGFAWAYVSQQCQKRDIWQGILFDLISPPREEKEEIVKYSDAQLAEKLSDVQKEKKCLVILDDIWSTEAWDGLGPAFPIKQASGKLLLTTRNEGVAQHIDPRCPPHKPQLLNGEDSLKLLKKKAFPEKENPDFKYVDIEELGRKMVERCAGLPLAIIVLGGLLATKHTLNEWNTVHGNINSYLRLAEGHEQHHSGVSEVLALSYHELPYQLKPCFLHLAHFPEDFDIPTEKLFRMWVAEGIVSPMQYDVEGDDILEDTAERYLEELMHRCMVQVGEREFTGRVKTCRLHDLMRDLCVLKAKQENYLKIVPLQDGNEQTVTIANSNSKIHRLAIHLPKKNSNSKSLNFYWQRERISHLRSLLILGPDVKIHLREMPFKFSGIELLKILDLEGFGFKEKLPRAIGNLIHLRYLGLYLSKFMRLPSSIGNLRCLQTLIITSNEFIKIPNVIWKMERLRHLHLPSWIMKCCGKLRMGNLKDLQTLRNFDARRCHVKELIKSTNLKDLKIRGLKSLGELEGILMRSQSVTFYRLHSLRIEFDSALEETDLQALRSGCPRLSTLYLCGRIVKLPEYPQFPSKLAQLTLDSSYFSEDPMPTLEKLPYLTILRLSYKSFIGKEMVCSSKGFPQLKSLELYELYDLEEWRVDEGAMPRLCVLKIDVCNQLKMVPNGLRFITTLQELKIMAMPKEFENRLRVVNEVEGEDLCKVQHVPSIIIQSFSDWWDQD